MDFFIIPGIIGAVYCALGKNYTANFIWVFSNALMAYRSYMKDDLDLTFSFSVFCVVALLGVIREKFFSNTLKLTVS